LIFNGIISPLSRHPNNPYMNEENLIDSSIFPGTPVCATKSNELAPKFLTVMVVAQCRAACEELADSIGSSPCEEHNTINDCLAACDEFTLAASRESRHTMRYAIWCSERCEDLRAACLRMDSPAAKSAAKWLKAVSKQMNHEIVTLQCLSKMTEQEVTWDAKVVAFDPFSSNTQSRASGAK
jgi:hypothetical protein